MFKIKSVLSFVITFTIVLLTQVSVIHADLLNPKNTNDEIISFYTKQEPLQKTPTFSIQSLIKGSPLLKVSSRDVAYPNKPDYSTPDPNIPVNDANQPIIEASKISPDNVVPNGNNTDLIYPENPSDDNLANTDTYTVYVSNAYQFLEAIFDLRASGVTNSENDPGTQEKSVSHISKIVLTKDIDLTNLPQAIKNEYPLQWMGDYADVYTRHFKLTIDGQDPQNKNIEHTINLGAYGFALSGDARNGSGKNTELYKEDWTWKNIHMYGQSWWGPTAANTGYSENAEHPEYTNKTLLDLGGYTKLNFANCTYIGCQLHNSYSDRSNALVTIKGRVSASSVRDFKYNNKQYVCEDKNQQIFEASKIRFEKNSYFTGYTYDGNAISLNSVSQKDASDSTVKATSSMTLEDGAKVFIYPHGDSSMENSGYTPYGMPYAVITQASNSQLTLKGDSQLNIISNDAPAKGQYVGDSNSLYTQFNDSTLADNPTLRQSNNLAGAIYLNQTNQVRYIKDDSGSPSVNIESNDQTNMNYDDSSTTTETGANGLNKYENGSQDDAANMLQNDTITAPNDIGDETSYDNNYSQYVNYLYSKGQDQSSTGATLNSAPLVAFDGTGNLLLDHGTFSIQTHNMHDFGGANVGIDPGRSGSIMYIGSQSKVTIKKDGIFRLLVNGSYPDGQSGGVVNLLTAANGLSLKISNPQEVTLDAGPNTNPDTHIVYVQGGNQTKGGGDVDLSDSTFSAWGNTSPITSPAGANLGSTPNKDVQVLNVPVQRIDVPFTYWAIPANLFQNGTNAVYARNQSADNSDLLNLNNALSAMNGKEFHKIQFGKLDSPKINNQNVYVIPHHPDKSDKGNTIISGTITHFDGDTPFTPTVPKISLSIKRADGTVYDLGDSTNPDQAYGIPATNQLVPVTPNILGRDSAGEQTGLPDTLGSLTNVTNPVPKYLNTASTKDKPTPLTMTAHADDGTDHSYKDYYDYKINVQQAIDNYNKDNPDHKITSLKADDTVQVGTVTNFQSTPLQNVAITNLFLDTTKHVDQYLIGDKVHVPVTYFDGDPDSKKISLSGSVTDNNQKQPLVDSINLADDYNHKSDVTQNWDLANITNSVDTADSHHTLDFSGQDDLTPANKYPFNDSDTLTYNYQVLPYPKYSGNKTLTRVNRDGHTVTEGANTLQTVFTPQAQHSLDKVKFDLGKLDGNVSKIDTNNPLTITATEPDDSSGTYTITNPSPDGNTTGLLTGTDFGLSSASFPAGTKFIVKQPINITAKTGSFDPSNDVLSTTDANDKTITLATSTPTSYVMGEGDVLLTVPNQLNFAATIRHRKQNIYPKSATTPQVSLKNNYSSALNITLTAKLTGTSNSKLKNLFFFKTDDSELPLNSDVTALSSKLLTSKNTKTLDLYSSSSGSTAKKFGPYLGMPADDSSLKGLSNQSNTATLTWTAINSLPFQ
ncbi:hypothetical protein [Bombilactobacillus thymidiniphilus]|uniref:WxL domain-containing protein n=1 Tax=Bombilactobacillus thymidiniphilus TaxID=2923363 RepID=A0ABY4PEV2_9LACO|nr:hypothetical protein [Bombilactobacillus thymidiniphilus]UQS84281.1 hypothetical protein MOO47_03790 [Bombilactobacillus thymidiniphilus]